ncbi:MAG: hypothetical protein ACXABY_10045 [Candidatus Thorarchaeota archaeon]|jgi:hypothetical protein
MANEKISELEQMGENSIVAADFLVVDDTDAVETKYIKTENILDSYATAFGLSLIVAADAAAVYTLLGVDDFMKDVLQGSTAANILSSLGLDGDLLTLALPANTTISAYGESLLDDADADTVRATLNAERPWTYSAQKTIAGGSATEDIETSIPAWVTDIEILISNVNLSTTGALLHVQFGGASGWLTSGYVCIVDVVTGSSHGEVNWSLGVPVNEPANYVNTYDVHGTMNLRVWDDSEDIYIADMDSICESAGTMILWTKAVGYFDVTETLTKARLGASAGTLDSGEVRMRYR